MSRSFGLGLKTETELRRDNEKNWHLCDVSGGSSNTGRDIPDGSDWGKNDDGNDSAWHWYRAGGSHHFP